MQKEQQEIDLHYQNKQEIIKSSFLGFFIGLAVIVPGISGSTIAILFKLYDKLLYAIGNLVKRFRACLLFLLPIAIGVIIGLLIGFITVQQLLKILPFAIVALFAGLMLGAFPAVTDEIKNEVTTPHQNNLVSFGRSLTDYHRCRFDFRSNRKPKFGKLKFLPLSFIFLLRLFGGHHPNCPRFECDSPSNGIRLFQSLNRNGIIFLLAK